MLVKLAFFGIGEADGCGIFVKKTGFPNYVAIHFIFDNVAFEFSPHKPHSDMRRFTFLHACTYMLFFSTINAASNSPRAYANDFINPNDILTRTLGDHTARARESVVEWARVLAAKGPWSELLSIPLRCFWLTQICEGVMNKTVSPPSLDKHDYMSWAP